MKNKIEFLFFLLFIKLFKIIGINKTRSLGKALGSILFYLIPIRKNVVMGNLKKAFPYKTSIEIKKIALENFRNITITFFEFMSIPSCSAEEVKSFSKIELSDPARNILNKKEGFIFLTAHFGSWEITGYSLPLHLGVKFHILAQPQRNSYINKWLNEARRVFGNEQIWVGVSVRRIFEAIRNKEAVGVAADQRGPADSPRIYFMGVPTCYHLGIASIITRTKAGVLVGFAVRQKDLSYRIKLEELSTVDLPEEETAKSIELMNRFIKIFEVYVRDYPEQYFWMHKIWKY
jgi:Kdo2-lipid IVA lauroyltransferase/acyltransferase